MADWANLPIELLVMIFSYLDRRERLACCSVCLKWYNAMNAYPLWAHVTIHMDTDLMEPSTVMLTRMFHKWFDTLEIGWAFPQTPSRWLPFKHKELTKRATRLMLILRDSFVQVKCIKIFDWFDIFRFKKIIHHFSRFLNNQVNLKKIVFFNANLHKDDCLKLLLSCLNSKDTITHMEIHNYHYYQSAFDSIQFLSVLEQLSHLTVLKLDYFVASRGVIDSILTSENRHLKHLEISIRETDTFGQVITEDQWYALKKSCPRLKVSFSISTLNKIQSICIMILFLGNVSHFDEISMFLKEGIPLSSFSMYASRTWDQSRSRNFRQTIYLLIRNYQKTLETVNLHLRDNKEIVDDLLVMVVQNCEKLLSFEFNGVIGNVKTLGNLCKRQFNKNSNLKHFNICPLYITQESTAAINKIYMDIAGEVVENKISITVRNANYKNLVYVYY